MEGNLANVGRKCPFTGKIIVPELPEKVSEVIIGTPGDILKVMRAKWREFTPSQRSGADGIKMMQQYRRMSHVFWDTTGGKAPPIYSED